MENLEEDDDEINDVGDMEIIEFNDGEDEPDEDVDENEMEDAEETSVVDDAHVVFTKHTGSVFSCSVEPGSGHLAVSGGEDDRAFVWNTTDGDVLFECKGHKDSVTCTCFNHDGKLVATGDMGGMIQVWQVNDKSKLWSFETSDLSWLKWHHSSNVLLAGTIDGDVWMWLIPGGNCKTFVGHGSSTDCCAVLPDGKRLAVGYGNGSIRIWDLKTVETLHNVTGGMAHQGSVSCIDCNQSGMLIMSGSVDGTAKIINSTTGKIVTTLQCSTGEVQQSNQSVESIGFSSSLPLCATGTLAGQLAIWDVSTHVQRQYHKHEAGIVRLAWDNSSTLLYTAALDGLLRLFDARTGNVVAQWSGHNGELLDFALSSDSSTVVTASDDKTCRVFHVNGPDR